ncbi:MAG: serine/threonine protein kinase, partial [Myxococcales bacterium]|nr:serine/threonine protein kinase [Myxococcales bacterium]
MEAVLGRGGMGWVERGYDLISGRPVAIKFLKLDGDRTESLAADFSWEVQAIARLSHPSVVPLYDYGHTRDGTPYMVMGLSPGTPLNEVPIRAITWPCVCAVLAQILSVLSHAHARGVFHHDLKPSNVLIYKGRDDIVRIQVIDFGISSVMDRRVVVQSGGPKTLIGTASYMAPEAIRAFHLFRFHPGVDLYALGIMAFELSNGERPFRAENTRELLRKHQIAELPPLALRKGFNAPPEFESFVRRLLDKSPRRRFSSAAEALLALRQFAPPE